MRVESYTLEQFKDWLTGAKITRPINSIVVHHFGIPSAAQWKGLRTLQAVKNEHMKRFDTYDIGYHIIVAPDGKIWIGRDINRVGAHAKGMNTGSVGIAFAANFDNEDPKTFAYDVGIAVIGEICKKLSLGNHRVFGHREVPNTHKTCPGKLINCDVLRNDVQEFLNGIEHKLLVIDNHEVPGAAAHILKGQMVADALALDRFFGWRTGWAERYVPVRVYLEHRGVKVIAFSKNPAAYYVNTDMEQKGY